MDELFPYILLFCGAFLLAFFRVERFRVEFQKIHPLGRAQAERTQKVARVLFTIGALWSLQSLLL